MASGLPTAIHYRLQTTRIPSYIVGGALFLVFALWLSSLWHWRNSIAIWWWVFGFAVAYVLVARAVWTWQQQLPTAWLVWNGVHWQLLADAMDTTIQTIPDYKKCTCVFDVQAALLLRLTGCTHAPPVPQVRWVWAQAASAPLHWHSLRAVVYAKKTI